MTEELPPWAFECEAREPQHFATGFCAVGGNVKVTCGYALYPLGVLLVVHTAIGPAPPQLWRRVWTTRESALDCAESIAADIEEYLEETLGCRIRQIEDLDLDDWLFHLDLCLRGQFH